MCGGVSYSMQGRDMRVYFPNPRAMLPVKKKDQSVVSLPWGRRQEQDGILPMGGWARLDAIYAGRWDKWFPVPVMIAVSSFMEKDMEGVSHWYDLTKGQWIQGLVARHAYEQRVYVVTVEPQLEDAVHDRWPRIMNKC
ncbi:MAG: hypothetical protein BMS9Abin36_1062 [Gammaproteobacteria bacterium]|nr:MAG: hypothetical protein BMS9Abin36_1062 [Gammaproteobacteria bacterium]